MEKDNDQSTSTSPINMANVVETSDHTFISPDIPVSCSFQIDGSGDAHKIRLVDSSVWRQNNFTQSQEYLALLKFQTEK